MRDWWENASYALSRNKDVIFLSRDLSYQTVRSLVLLTSVKMERSIFLACLWLTLIGIIQGDTMRKSRVRHLFVQRRSPIPGSPKKLFKLAHEVENKLQSSSDQNVHKLLSRVRRSLNPDVKPSVNEVRVVC